MGLSRRLQSRTQVATLHATPTVVMGNPPGAPREREREREEGREEGREERESAEKVY
jgi:hypothetical protein